MTKSDPARTAVRAKMRANREQGRRADQAVIDHRRKRAEIYAEGRALDPPMTYAEIAEIYQITEAAVMQVVRRWMDSRG